MGKPDFKAEWPTIRSAAVLHGVDPLFMCAIRKAESGPESIDQAMFGEFGLPHKSYPTYQDQVDGACATVRRHLTEFLPNPLMELHQLARSDKMKRAVYTNGFIVSLQRRYAPAGASNDPTGLNNHWFKNVSQNYIKWSNRGWDLTGDWQE